MDPEMNVTVHLYRATEHDPEYIDARLAWAEYKISQREYDEALADIEIAFEIDPENPVAYSLLAQVYIIQNLPEEALEAAQAAYQRDLVNVDNYYLLGYALILNERHNEAIPLIETYLSHLEEDYFAWYLLGRAYQGIGNPEVAVQIFTDTYAERRNIYEMSYYWGLALIDIEEYDSAIERLDVPIERIPSWFEPYVAQAEAYYLNGQADRGKEIIEDSSEFARTDRQLAALYYWRAILYTELGYPGIAETNWEALLALPPSEVPAEWWSEAQTNLGTSSPATTPAEATPTRVPSPTPEP
jgi:tetratricopeptide (TPR) repeat protein